MVGRCRRAISRCAVWYIAEVGAASSESEEEPELPASEDWALMKSALVEGGEVKTRDPGRVVVAESPELALTLERLELVRERRALEGVVGGRR